MVEKCMVCGIEGQQVFECTGCSSLACDECMCNITRLCSKCRDR